MNRIVKAQVAGLFTALFWGYSFVWTSQVLNFFNPMSIVFMRLVIALCILIPLVYFIKMRQRVTKKQLGQLAVLALFQPFLYFIFETYGVKLTTSTVSSVIISMIPLMVPVGSFLVYKERLTPINAVGIAVSFAGVALIIFDRAVDFSGGLLGIGVLFLAVLTAVVYMMIIRRMSGQFNIFTINVYQNFFGLLYFLPFFLFDGLPVLLEIDFNQVWILPLVALAVFGSTAAFLLYTYSIGVLGPSKAAAFNNLIPVVTAVAAYWHFAESITFQKSVGIAIVITGLYLAQKQVKRGFVARG